MTTYITPEEWKLFITTGTKAALDDWYKARWMKYQLGMLDPDDLALMEALVRFAKARTEREAEKGTG